MDFASANDTLTSDLVGDKPGFLVVVGLGISLGHMTLDSVKALRSADVVYYLATNTVSQKIILDQNPNAHSLHECYAIGKPRPDSYKEMVDIVMAEVRTGKNVCFAIYGHPGVFAYPTHVAIETAKREGYQALMLPGISAEDCIYADLGLDPGRTGCQSFEATDFMFRCRIWDPYSTLILWQVSVVGVRIFPGQDVVAPGFEMLKTRLIETYGPDHKGVLYEAASLPLCEPRLDEKTLGEIQPEDFFPETTFVIRPLPDNPRKNEEFEKLIL